MALTGLKVIEVSYRFPAKTITDDAYPPSLLASRLDLSLD
jgi:hypothetical protein